MSDLVNPAAFRDRDLRAEGLFVAEGRLLVERTISSGLETLAVWAAPATADEAGNLAARAPRAIPVTVCTDEEMSAIAGFPFHRGILAVARRPELRAASEGIQSVCANSSGVLVLPAITDPGNLGTLLRSALAFGFDTVWLGRESCDPFNRKALRASMGAALTLNLRIANPDELALLRGAGLSVYAGEMSPEAQIAGEEHASGRCALVLGNEHDGIPPEWRKGCDRSVMIPVSADVDSLNVAIAGSILMWELGQRQDRP